MEFRPIQSSDVERMAEFAIRGLRPDLYPMLLSIDKVLARVQHFVESKGDFNMAAFVDGYPVGGIAAIKQEMPWFERSEAHIVFCFATLPGVGRKLIREALLWAEHDPMIRRVLWSFNFDAEPRMMRIAERWGFNSFSVMASRYKV